MIERQTGRTTRQLEAAAKRGAVFIVLNQEQIRYCKRILVDVLRLSSDAVRFYVATPLSLDRLAGVRDIEVDHAVWTHAEWSALQAVRKLVAVVESLGGGKNVSEQIDHAV